MVMTHLINETLPLKTLRSKNWYGNVLIQWDIDFHRIVFYERSKIKK